MKKSVMTVVMCAMFVLGMTGMSIACDGPDCYGSGNFNIDAKAISGGIDAGVKTIPNGIAGGAAGAVGATKADAYGYAQDAVTEGHISVVGGGLYNQYDYTFGVPSDLSIGVGSQSNAEAITEGHVSLFANADDPSGWFDYNQGVAAADFRGFAAQGTLDGSLLGESPYFFETNGVTGGLAGQGSLGTIEGGAFAYDESSAFLCWRRPDYAHANAGIDMWGGSYSESYRYVDWGCESRTEGMGTNVGAYTNVTSFGDSSCDGYTNGGFVAVGGAGAMTAQSGNGGAALATAVGGYTGAGSLNCNYNGSVQGQTYTSITTVNGMNGSIVSAGSSMRVESHTGSMTR